ncbi:SAUR-like auxin-responsive protein family [Melia azedarach]|uniref:SAUR-like auxin-responsive protein family n=1 Tax=Melia azedarach TaxID=155640 RepID=A0ACC1YZH7_MELAZ|nr:SAUR-like auxin-responsive protein family [Melia azedarach]
MFCKRSVRRSLDAVVRKLSVGGSKSTYERLVIVEGYKTAEARKGCVPMYVGEEHKKRYDVPVNYLSLPRFKELMEQSEDVDFDFKIDGPINLGCTTEAFDQLLKQASQAALGQLRSSD